MDIKDLKEKRVKLEQEIGKLLSEFSWETELTVSSIGITQISEMGKNHPVTYLVDASIELPRY